MTAESAIKRTKLALHENYLPYGTTIPTLIYLQKVFSQQGAHM